MVAGVILENYTEARVNASRWSGIYWGFTFIAAAFSAMAGLILKIESFLKSEAIRKDVAALLSVCAAVLISISASGDFQRKWQANRIAAAELEWIGYRFLEQNGKDSRSYLAAVGKTLRQRHFSIVGNSDHRPAGGTSGEHSPAGK